MMTQKKDPVRLYRADPRESVLQNDIVIRISVTTAILLSFILFFIVCFALQGPTYGFL